MRELELHGRKFTWGNNMLNPTFEKLDRILCCVDWGENYPLTEVTARLKEKSDHTPLFLNTGDMPKTNPIFRFENAWFLRDEIDKIIIDTEILVLLGLILRNGRKGSKILCLD